MFFFYFLVVVEHRQDQGGTWGSSDPSDQTSFRKGRKVGTQLNVDMSLFTM